MDTKFSLNIDDYREVIRNALAEDLGSGDATTAALISNTSRMTGFIRNREDCVVAGLSIMSTVFEELDSGIEVNNQYCDGQSCAAGTTISRVSGSTAAILSGERTALNFLQHLSGIATITNCYVRQLGDSTTRILDTRKTTPGLRQLEKYAVLMGGGMNHRFGLFDRIMIKDNHRHIISLEKSESLKKAVENCRCRYPALEVEIEVDNLDQLREALEAKADYILLDNMSTAEMREGVKIRNHLYSQSLLEASGGITLERISELGSIGLDFISVGAITHSARAVDIGLDLEAVTEYPEAPK